MKMIDKPELHNNFKVIMQNPTWLKSSNSNMKEIIYLRSKSLDNWAKHMLINTNKNKSSYKFDSAKWSGCRTWEDYLEIVENGDNEIIKRIKTETKKVVNKLEKEHQKIIKGYKFDVVGEQFDIGLVLSGIPEVWLEPEEIETEIPKITIKLNLSYSANITTDTIIKNASKILATSKILDELGILVKIEGYNACFNYDKHGSKRALIIENIIKDFDEPLNFAKVSAFISPTQLRRGGFFITEQIADDLDEGYGSPLKCEGILEIANTNEISTFEKTLFKDLGV